MGGRSAETKFGQSGVEFYLKDSDNDVKVQICEGAGSVQAGGTEEEETQQQQKSEYHGGHDEDQGKGRKWCKNSWWVSELLAADCKERGVTQKWENTVQQWYTWLQDWEEKDGEKMKEKHQKLVSRMISRAEG